ncbi:MAG TPA: hypothetical protein PKD78_15315, partial [Saprospiraceae bacterium]|nr:hypothetical protein [Saprospiraceae bacterium]
SPPTPVSVAFPVIRPLGCGGDGMAFAKGAGGTGPYNYTWSTGSLLSSTFVGSAGTVTVTVTDARGCSKIASVPVPNGGTVRKNIAASICIGESWVVDGVAYIQSGNYTYQVPGTLCDTTVYLSLEVVNPADALSLIPAEVPVPDCSKEYGAEICAMPIAGTSFVWKNEGTITGAQTCLKGLSGSTYLVTAFRSVSGKLCKAARSIEVLQGNFTASIQGLVEPNYCNAQASISVELVASTTAANPTYTWRYGGNVIGQQKTLLFTITDWQQQLPTMPTLTVHDGGTCVVEADNQVVVLQPPPYDIRFSVKNATAGKSDGAVIAQIDGGIPSFNYLWSTGATTPQIEMLSAGSYCLTVTDQENCTRTACATVSTISSIQALDMSEKIGLSPNPVGPERVLVLEMPAGLGRQKLDLRILDAYGRAFLCDF